MSKTTKTTRRLGRGLDTLVTDLQQQRLSSAPPDAPVAADAPADAPPGGQPMMIEVDRLSPNPYQPRGAFTDDSVRSLAESLGQNGMICPISARHNHDRLEIVAGERRWRAARLAGLPTVPVIFTQVDDRQMLEMALIENIQREDLNAIDRARAYRRYCDQFEAPVEALAQRLGEDRTTVANYLRLLDLSDEIKDMVASGRLSMGHARCIVGVQDDRMRLRLAGTVTAHDLSVRALEQLIRREKRGRERSGAATAPGPDKTPHLRDLEQRFSMATGTKVTIQQGRSKGSGRITIEYYSLDDFDRIAARLGVGND
jgi:ParB family chromosome partitioning protein